MLFFFSDILGGVTGLLGAKIYSVVLRSIINFASVLLFSERADIFSNTVFIILVRRTVGLVLLVYLPITTCRYEIARELIKLQFI